MIPLDAIICSTCKHCKGIAWAGDKEYTEYIVCRKSTSNNASDLLTFKGGKSECEEYEERP